jgi:hypothetical protein
MGKRAPKVQTTSIESAVSDAFSGMSDLKDELENWYDNLHENFQNGSKGEELQEAMGCIDEACEPTIPDCLTEGPELPEVTYYEAKGSSRSARRDTYVAMLDGAIDAANTYIETLNALEYDDDGKLKQPEGEEEKGDPGEVDSDWPEDSDTRDSWVNDIESFVSECEDAKSSYENVNFPGMYG